MQVLPAQHLRHAAFLDFVAAIDQKTITRLIIYQSTICRLEVELLIGKHSLFAMNSLPSITDRTYGYFRSFMAYS